MKKSLIISILCLLLGLVIGAGGYLIYDLATEPPPTPTVEPIPAEQAYAGTACRLVESAYQVLSDLRAGDYASLAQRVHPVYGVYFSPYSTIDLNANQWFAPSTLARLGRDKNSLIWGTLPGSGEPIDMTAEEYFARYVYDRDYLYAPVISVDRAACPDSGRANTAEAFPDGRFVDLYIPADSEDVGWTLLRLVFVDYEGSPMLAAVVHSESSV